MPSTLEPYSLEWLEQRRQENQAKIADYDKRRAEYLVKRKASQEKHALAVKEFEAKLPKPPPEKSANMKEFERFEQAGAEELKKDYVPTKAETFIHTIAGIVYKPARRDLHRAAYSEARKKVWQNIDHAYMYHGSRFEYPVGSKLIPRTEYDGKYGKGRTLLFGTRRKPEAQGYASGSTFYQSMRNVTPKSLPISRKAGWLYTMEHSKDWEAVGGQGMEQVTERAQKIVARERVIMPRHVVPVTRNELVAAAAAGIAVAAGTAGSAYYYRTQHNKRVRVKNPNWQHARRITH